MLEGLFHNECILLNSVFPRGNFFTGTVPRRTREAASLPKRGSEFLFPRRSALISVLSKCGTKSGGDLVPLLGLLPRKYQG